jgi:hypothetical protein
MRIFMKRTAIIALTALLGTAAAASAAPADKPLLSYKLTGILAGISGGEYNDGIRGENGYLAAASTSLTGAYKEIKRGLGFQLEVILPLGRRFGVGVGGGYFRIRGEGSVEYTGLSDGTAFDAASTMTSRLSVLPFFVNLHYTHEFGPRLSLDAYAGPLFQIVQFNADNPSTSTLLATDQTVTFTATQTSLGLQAGIGAAYRLTKGIAVIADALYRSGSVSDLKGNWTAVGTNADGTIAGSSDAYYLWDFDATAGGKTFTRTGFYDTDGPKDLDAFNARKASIGLDGLSFQAGIRISL